VRSPGEAQRGTAEVRPPSATWDVWDPGVGQYTAEAHGRSHTDSEDARRDCRGRARVGPLDAPTLLVGCLLRDIWERAGVVPYPSPVRPLSVHGEVFVVVYVAPPAGRKLGSGRR
jgi:hypothetical protein